MEYLFNRWKKKYNSIKPPTIIDVLGTLSNILVLYVHYIAHWKIFEYMDKEDQKCYWKVYAYSLPFEFFLHISINAFFYVLYTNEFPFFEQFKTLKQPWPWKDKDYSDEIKKLLKHFAINYFF